MQTSSEQLERYHADGFLSPIRVVDADTAQRYREAFDELEALHGREHCQVGLHERHLDQRFLWDLASNPVILDWMEALIGPNVLLLHSHVFCKYGPTEQFVAWHQDVTYWGLEPPMAVTAWYAIDDSDSGNGCMRVLPGSHKSEILEHGKSSREGNLLSVNQEVVVADDAESRAVDLVLKAGEISIHHGRILHDSQPNRSTRRRSGFTVRYVPTTVRPTGEKEYHPIVMRGEDREQHFGTFPAPFPTSSGGG